MIDLIMTFKETEAILEGVDYYNNKNYPIVTYPTNENTSINTLICKYAKRVQLPKVKIKPHYYF
jgi:hypothetical protein